MIYAAGVLAEIQETEGLFSIRSILHLIPGFELDCLPVCLDLVCLRALQQYNVFDSTPSRSGVQFYATYEVLMAENSSGSRFSLIQLGETSTTVSLMYA